MFIVFQRAVLEEKEQLIGDLQFSLDERSTQLEEVVICNVAVLKSL